MRSIVVGGALALTAWLGAQPGWAQECPSDGCPQEDTSVGAGSPVPTVPTTFGTVPTTLPGSGAPTSTVPTTVPGGVGSPTAVASPTSVAAGGAVTLRGTGFAPNQALQLSLTSTPPTSLGSTQSDATGAYSASVTVPATVAAGSYQLTVSGSTSAGGTAQGTTPLTVSLPRTGVVTDVLAPLGALTLAAGVVLLLRSQWSPAVSTANWSGSSRRRWM